jgi:hypothetical protein
LQRRFIEAFLEVLYSTKKELAMTRQDDCSVIRDLVDLAMEHSPDAMAAVFTSLMNHAMQIEREQVLTGGSRSEPIVKATPMISNRRR